MKWKLDRIISVATLVVSLAALFLVLKKPTAACVGSRNRRRRRPANVESLEKKLEQLEQPKGSRPGGQPRCVSIPTKSPLHWRRQPHRFPRAFPRRLPATAPSDQLCRAWITPLFARRRNRRGRASGEGL